MKRILLALFIAFGLLLRVAVAQEPGRIAVVEGNVERGRASAWLRVEFGAELVAGDELRTDDSGRVQIVLPDGTVLNVGRSTDLLFHEIGSPGGPATRTLLHLARGSLRPVVAAQSAGRTFEVETPTAIAAVRGTEFVIVYNPVVEVSEVVGVTDTVYVSSVLARVRGEALVTARELTTVSRGHAPTAPKRIPDELFRQYIEGLQFIGEGAPESQTNGLPLLSGAAVPPADRADAAARPNHLDVTTPGDFLAPPEGSSAGEAGQPPKSVGSPGGVGIQF